MKETKTIKKLELKKETVTDLSTLSHKEMKDVKGAADYKACWENLWTMYYCDVMWTGKEPV